MSVWREVKIKENTFYKGNDKELKRTDAEAAERKREKWEVKYK